MDKDEIVEFNDDGGWELLDDDFDLSQTSWKGMMCGHHEMKWYSLTAIQMKS
jgi:hypothetical protein